MSSPNRILQRFWLTPAHEALLGIIVGALVLIAYFVVVACAFVLLDVIAHYWQLREERQPRPWERCEGCGYNLLASRDRCPECGRRIPPWPVEQPRIRIYRGVVLIRSGRGSNPEPDDLVVMIYHSGKRWLKRKWSGLGSARRRG